MKQKNGFLVKGSLIVKHRARLILVSLILLAAFLVFSEYIKATVFVLIFIALSSVSKIYHRLFRSTLGIDLVFFSTVMTALVYKNILLSLIVAFPGLILADTVGTKFSPTSIVSLILLTVVSAAAKLLSGLPLIYAAIILLVIFEAGAWALYNLQGSSLDKVLLFVSSHFVFNMFMIFTFSETLAGIML